MPPIYISYRPSDATVVQRIVTRAYQTYGSYSVVMNPEQKRPDRETIDQRVDYLIYSCSTILIVIGPDWTGLDEFGRFKLSTADVPVHQEVKWALQHDRKTIAVLVKGAKLPARDSVPEKLQGILDCLVVELRPKTFRHDLDRLIPAPTIKEQLRYHFFSFDRRKHRVVNK